MSHKDLGSSSSAGNLRRLPSLDPKKLALATGAIEKTPKRQPQRRATDKARGFRSCDSDRLVSPLGKDGVGLLPSLKSAFIATIPHKRNLFSGDENIVVVRDPKGSRGGLLERRRDSGPKVSELDRTGKPATLLECFTGLDENATPDMEDIDYFLSRGAEVNTCDETFGWSPLLFAVRSGDLDMVAMLLRAKADIQSSCNVGNTALHIAARAGDLVLVQYLIARKVNIEAQSHAGWTAITFAASSGHLEVTRTLMAAKAEVVVSDELGRHACMWAARQGHADVTKLLLETGFDLGLRDNNDFTVADHAAEHRSLHEALLRYEHLNEQLLEAARQGDLEGCERALKAGAKANISDRSGVSAVELAIEYPSREIVQVLFKYKAHFSQSNERFGSIKTELESLAKRQAETAAAILETISSCDLMVDASEKANWDGVNSALRCGAYVETRDDLNRTPLMWAVIHGEVNQCEALVCNHKACIDSIDGTGWTALHFAARYKHVNVVKKLLELRANPVATNFLGRRPAHEAAIADDAGPVFEAFLEVSGKDMLSFPDRDGHVLLQLCAIEGSCAAFRYLLTVGADPAVRDPHGRQVLSLATFHGQLALVQQLLAHLHVAKDCLGINPKSSGGLTLKDAVTDVDKEGCMALIIAVKSHHREVVQALLAERPYVEIGAVDNSGNTALMWAAKRHDRACVELLLNAEADVFATNIEGQQAIELTKDERIKVMLQTEMQKQIIEGRLGFGADGLRPGATTDDVDQEGAKKKIACRLRIENLSESMVAKELEDRIRKIFRSTGSTVDKMDVVVDPITLRPRGIAYVHLGVKLSEDDVKVASVEGVEAQDAYDIMMSRIKLQEAKDLLGPRAHFAKEVLLK